MAGRCPADPGEVAEAYWMRRLPSGAAREFALHCNACPDCATSLIETLGFIEMVRAALTESPPQGFYRCKPVIFGKPPAGRSGPGA